MTSVTFRCPFDEIARLEGKDIIRVDRGGRGGGVCVYLGGNVKYHHIKFNFNLI